MNRRLTILLIATLALPAAAAAAVLFAGDGVAQGEELPGIDGDLGLGPALDLRRCPRELDPRLGVGWAWACEPVPCGMRACPVHAGR